jgi:RHS repeat-associated protein
VQYTYNADGTLATKTDAKQNMESYSYDGLQRLTAIHRWVFNNGQLTEDGAQLQTFTYDDSDTGGGRLSQAGFGGPMGPSQLQFWYLYSYTPAGNVAWRRLLLSEPGSYTAGLDVSYTYDNEGNVTSIKYPDTQPDANTAVTGPTYTYALDGLKRPVGLTDNSGGTWASGVTYNAANQMTGGTFGPGAWSETRTYNSLLQLTREQQTSSQLGVLMDMTYTYSSNQNNGQVAQTVDAVSGETISYQYDALKRLSSASSTQSWAETYTYDGFGNLTQMTPTGTAPTLSVLVDVATNRMQGTGMGYDANGNLTNTAAWSLTYDVANRVSVASQELYAYAADNHRIYRRTPGGVDEIYVYGMAGEKLGTYTVTGTGTASGSDVIFLSQKSTNVYFAGKMITAEGNQVEVDRLGSVRSGGPPNPGYQDQRYYPYGVEFPTTIPPGQPGAGQLQYSTPNDREKYATYTRDSATGLDYAVNRYYSSQWGRFIRPDPDNGSADSQNPQTWNRYGYVLADPVNTNDPGGLNPCGFGSSVTVSYEGSAMSCPSSDLMNAYNSYVAGVAQVYALSGTPTGVAAAQAITSGNPNITFTSSTSTTTTQTSVKMNGQTVLVGNPITTITTIELSNTG